MRILTLPITPALSGLTVKQLLRQELRLSSSLLKSLKWRENAILLNGSPVTVRAAAYEGDVLTVDVSDPPTAISSPWTTRWTFCGRMRIFSFSTSPPGSPSTRRH